MGREIWEGESNHQQVIGQLLGYLPWREAFGIVVTFSRASGFSTILEKTKTAILETGSYIDDSLHQANGKKTHYVWLHRFPTDPDKRVEIHTFSSTSDESGNAPVLGLR